MTLIYTPSNLRCPALPCPALWCLRRGNTTHAPKMLYRTTHTTHTTTKDESPGPETAIYYSIFNGLGVLPAVFASVLCGGGSFGKGRQPVPPQPFVFAAFALGYFALGPYLAVRNYLPKIDDGEEASLLEAGFHAFSVFVVGEAGGGGLRDGWFHYF